MNIDFSIFELDKKIPNDVPISTGKRVEPIAVEIFFRNKSNNDITLDKLWNDYLHDPSACQAFMTPEAFAFFLPAFMLITYNNFYESDMIGASTIENLIDIAKGNRNDFKEAVLRIFSKEQLKLIANFLVAMRDMECSMRENIEIALNLFWGHFL